MLQVVAIMNFTCQIVTFAFDCLSSNDFENCFVCLLSFRQVAGCPTRTNMSCRFLRRMKKA